MIVGLRHDLDTVYGLRWGLPKIVSLEKRHGVTSTFFVRVDIIHSDKDKRVLKKIVDDGWEIGLHLINTTNDSKLMSPKEELERLKELLDVLIYGVTPCGSTIGFQGDITWRIMDSLGLKYMEGYGMPDFKANTFVFPTHLSLDIYYVRNFGEKRGYQKFKEDLVQKSKDDKIVTVLTHPEGFLRSVRSHGLMKVPLTLLRKGMMNKIYDAFLCEFKERAEFKKYFDIFNVFA